MSGNDWTVKINKLESGREAFDAALFSLSNGYAGVRGTDEETYTGAPRTFIAGLYNPDPLGMETMASVPNWLATRLFVEGSQFFYEVGDLLEYCKILDMRCACLKKIVLNKNREGKTTRIETERFVSMDNHHLLCMRYSVTPINYSGEITVHTGLDGLIASSGFDHFDEIDKGHNGNIMFNIVKTNRANTTVGMAAAILTPFKCTRKSADKEKQSWLEITFKAKRGKTYSVDKLVGLYTSREVRNPKNEAIKTAKSAAKSGFDKEFKKHSAAWIKLWNKHDLIIEGDALAQRSIRFCIFQLLSYGPYATEDTNIGAKALTGDRYRGHVFWDTEIYLQPFYNLSLPELGQKLLMYRYNRLKPAKEKAKRLGARGACFVWESADTGRESVPIQWIFPNTGEIEMLAFADEEIHTSLDVCYAVWHYYLSTGNEEFMRKYGLELMLESALFYATRAELNKGTGEYEIHNITGPDEHHYGANNSAYMNTMAKWNIETALMLLKRTEKTNPALAKKLLSKTKISGKDILLMRNVADHIRINYDPKTKLIEEFDGYFKLRNLRPDTPGLVPGEKRSSQVIKQADVVLLMFLLGEKYDRETKRVNYEYYEPRCDHVSSLSASAHSILAAEIGKLDDAYKFLLDAARIDLKSEKADCIEGIHIGSCGGAWQAVVFGFGGLRINSDGLSLNPQLPKKWKSLSFSISYQGNNIRFHIKHRKITIESQKEVEITIDSNRKNLVKGKNNFTCK